MQEIKRLEHPIGIVVELHLAGTSVIAVMQSNSIVRPRCEQVDARQGELLQVDHNGFRFTIHVSADAVCGACNEVVCLPECRLGGVERR